MVDVHYTVKFKVLCPCETGQVVGISGNIRTLGSWDPKKAVQLTPLPNNWWETSNSLPTQQHFEYKYFIQKGAEVVWEHIRNRFCFLETPNNEFEDEWGIHGSNHELTIRDLRLKHAEYLQQFEECVSAKKWSDIHQNHYDWWMFPIPEKSSYGWKYSVWPDDVKKLKQDKEFMLAHRRGILLLMLAWGWDIENRTFVQHPGPGQQWTHYPVRLYKAGLSAQCFEHTDYFESMRLFAQLWHEKDIDAFPLTDGARVYKLFALPGSDKIKDPPPRYQ